jgi:hypothetical protein
VTDANNPQHLTSQETSLVPLLASYVSVGYP